MMPTIQRYFEVPPELPSASFRQYKLGLYSYPVCGLIHFGYIFLFAWLGVYSLSWFNVGSTIVWLLGIMLHLRLHIYTGLAFVLTEVAAHAALAVSILGLSSGYQYYLFASSVVVFLTSFNIRYRFLTVIANAALFAAMQYAYSINPPNPPVSIEVVRMFGVLNILTVIALLALFSHYYASAAEGAEAALAAEHKRSESLLRNILPTKVIERLKSEGQTIAEGYNGASVLFADIVGFTPMSQQITAEDVVALLNHVFSKIDDLVAAHQLEKIKTIGDAYMVAAGIPQARSDHAQAIADFSIDLLELVKSIKNQDGQPLQMRVGINSGPVVAGVIGKHKFAYDLWGDAVNTAARMESHGLPCEIQITRETWELLGPEYMVEERGLVSIKGKGEMRTYLLKGRQRG